MTDWSDQLERLQADVIAIGSQGELKILEVKTSVDQTEEGEPVTRVYVLASPPGERGTWELEDVRHLRRLIEREVSDLRLPTPFVMFSAEGDEEFEEAEVQ